MKHRFHVSDFQVLKEYQIEVLAFRRDELSPSAHYESLNIHLVERLPPGRVVSYEQLHRVLGELAELEQRIFKSKNEQVIISFEIRPCKIGDQTYTTIIIDPLLL